MKLTSRPIVPLCVAGLSAWLFADALFGGGMFVFRDAAHFYYPLLQFSADEWAAGRVPLWNPYENLGQPLAGNPAAAVFYPGKLIFALPLDFAWTYKIYILGHLLLAAWAAYRLARQFQASIEAAGLCAISYAFSGNVLFQYCNVVFLVGAAWLPLALLATDRMLGEGLGGRDEGVAGAKRSGAPARKVWWAVVLGVVLAMMTLGGDPQMAYNAGLLAALYALWLWWQQSPLPVWRRIVGCVKRTNRNELPRQGEKATSVGTVRCTHPARPVLLAVAMATGLILSAVQVLPSIEFARRSGRATVSTADAMLGRGIERGTHHEQIYDFSVAPWRLAEYVWPNVSGRQFPEHRRWLEVIPAEDRLWTPSLYMGLLPLLLALGAMRFRQKRGQDSFLIAAEHAGRCEPAERISDVPFFAWVVVAAVAAGFGWYGVGWVVEEIRFAGGGDLKQPGPIADPVGGLYWLLTVILPGYSSFRYPAKLLVVAALGLSVLAARGWDRTFAEGSARVRRWLLWLGGLSLGGAIGALAIRPFWHGWMAEVKPDRLFGPLDTTGAADDLLWAFSQTALLCGVYWWLLGRTRPARGKKSSDPFFRWAALILVAVDLAVAQRWMIACAPAEQWQRPSAVAMALEKRKRGQSPFSSSDVNRKATRASTKKGTVPGRVLRHPMWMRPQWETAGSPERMAPAMAWDVDTLWPKYNLAPRIAILQVPGSMMSYDYEVFLRSGRKADGKRAVPLCLAEYAILPGEEALAGGERIEVGAPDVSLWHNSGHLPRAWIVRDVDVLPPLESDDPQHVRRRTEEALHPGGRPRDLRRWAVVEIEGGLESFSSGDLPGAETCQVAHYDPACVKIKTTLKEPGLVVLADQFYPGWQLHVQTDGKPARPVPILRTNRVMRGAWLPQGRHRLVYRYRPGSVQWGAIVSALGWIALVLGVGWRLKRRGVKRASRIAA